MREKLIEIRSREIDVDDMRPRREGNHRRLVEIDIRIAIENHVKRLMADNASDDVVTFAQCGGARM